MKSTGMVRRIDELGRIVIPKEIRKQLMMKEGESISFSLEDDKIILTKFSMLNKLGSVIQVLLDGLYMKYHNTFLLCDHHHVIASSMDGLSLYQRRNLPEEMSFMIDQAKQCEETLMQFGNTNKKVSIIPLMHEQKSMGAIVMLTNKSPYYMIDKNLLEFVKEVIEKEMESCV